MWGGGGGVQGAKIFVNDQSRSLGAPLAKCLEILCAAMPYSAAWVLLIAKGHPHNINIAKIASELELCMVYIHLRA